MSILLTEDDLTADQLAVLRTRASNHGRTPREEATLTLSNVLRELPPLFTRDGALLLDTVESPNDLIPEIQGRGMRIHSEFKGPLPCEPWRELDGVNE